MSLNVSGSKFVYVYDTELLLQVSDKIIFAHLSTSRKTGKDTETESRAYSSWNARFVGNAFEPAKGLAAGSAINIINGWVTNEGVRLCQKSEKKEGDDKRKGSTRIRRYPTVTITEFEVCDAIEGEDADGQNQN